MTIHSAHHAIDGDFDETRSAVPVESSKLTFLARDWVLRNLDIDEERTSDIVLSIYEALANCADHAYRGREQPGDMTLQIIYDADTATARVCVTDGGAWLDPQTHPLDHSRGRGLTLMRAYADEFNVDGRADGTTVCLHFERCPRLTEYQSATVAVSE